MEFFREAIGYYDALTKQNPWMVALLLPVITGGLYWIRNTPIKIMHALVHHSTTRLQMNNAGWGSNDIQYTAFMCWYMESAWARFSRTISLTNRESFYSPNGRGGALIGPGRGRHIFFFKGRLFWFEKVGLESSGTEKQKEEIQLVTLGRSHKPLTDLVDQFKYVEPEESIGIFNLTKDGWRRMTSIVRRPMDSVCIDPSIKNHLTSKIDRFIQEKDWFSSKGLPHKLTVLLYGQPGTGKTSLVQAVASHYRRNVMVMDLSSMTNSSLQSAIASLPKGSILLLEDIDAATTAVNTRSSQPTQVATSGSPRSDNPELTPCAAGSLSAPYGEPIMGFGLDKDANGWGLTLSGLLNALQGVIALDDVMVFMTTNHPERLDQALIRTGRVDCKYQIGPMQSAQIHEFIHHMYPGVFLSPDITFRTTVGSDVQNAFLEHPHDVVAFGKAIGWLEKELGDAC